MNRRIVAALLIFLLSIPIASASITIQNVSITPTNSWIGENVEIQLSCSDNENNSIDSVYADITGPGITLPTLYFTGFEDYYLSISKDYLDRTGVYDVLLYCRNNASNTTSYSSSFSVSELTGYISDIKPSPAYIGDTIEIDFVLEKDGSRITSNADFNVTLNSVLKNLKVLPAYDSIRGWILKLEAPGTTDSYDLSVKAFYDTTSVSDSETIEIKNKVEFEIVSIDKTWLKSDDNVTIVLKAMEQGSVIDLDKSDVGIKVGSGITTTNSFSRQGNNYVLSVMMPSLSYGQYQLEAYMNHNGIYYSDSILVDFVVEVSGNFVDEDNKAISTNLNFMQQGISKLNLFTDAYGYYSGSLPVGTYDLTVKFPKSILELESVSVSEFDNPIVYFYGDDFEIPGIRNAGLHSFEIDLSYSSVDLELDYQEKNVLDESNLRVYKCSEWNTGKLTCNDDWYEIGYDIDTIRNSVKISSSELSAFVIGEVKDLDILFSTDKNEYNLNDVIKVSGIVKDDDGLGVSDANLKVFVKNTNIVSEITADNNGVFSVDLQVPSLEGNYTIVVEAEKQPYNDYEKQDVFSVTKSKSLSIEFPETVRIERGGNYNQEFKIINSGQSDLKDLSIYLDGLSEGQYTIKPSSIDINADKEKKISIDFSIPVYAETGITSISIMIENEDVKEEFVFGLNIFEGDVEDAAPSTGLFTGISMPQISTTDIVYVTIFALVCFSAAILLKKRKINDSRGNIRNFLFGVKKYMDFDYKPSNLRRNGSYDRLIITEFPNVLKFSKNLTQKGDK